MHEYEKDIMTQALELAEQAGAQGDVQSRASLLCSAGNRAAERPRSSDGRERARPQRWGGLWRRQSAVQTLEASPSEMEKLITLLDGEALRGEEPVLTK